MEVTLLPQILPTFCGEAGLGDVGDVQNTLEARLVLKLGFWFDEEKVALPLGGGLASYLWPSVLFYLRLDTVYIMAEDRIQFLS
jgi:hypothetical protein